MEPRLEQMFYRIKNIGTPYTGYMRFMIDSRTVLDEAEKLPSAQELLDAIKACWKVRNRWVIGGDYSQNNPKHISITQNAFEKLYETMRNNHNV